MQSKDPSDFDAEMSGIKFRKGNGSLRPIYKNPFHEIFFIIIILFYFIFLFYFFI